MPINGVDFGGLTSLKRERPPSAETTGQIATNNQPLFNFTSPPASVETSGQIASNSGSSNNLGGSLSVAA